MTNIIKRDQLDPNVIDTNSSQLLLNKTLGSHNYIATDTGAADAYIVALSPAIISYVAGQVLNFIPTNTNTTTSTINVNGLGVKTIKKMPYGIEMNVESYDLVAGSPCILHYDGANFILLNHEKKLRSPSALSLSTIYQASYDGYVQAVADGNTSDVDNLQQIKLSVYIDSFNPPTTVRQASSDASYYQLSSESPRTRSFYTSASFYVKKGYYFKVVASYTNITAINQYMYLQYLT